MKSNPTLIILKGSIIVLSIIVYTAQLLFEKLYGLLFVHFSIRDQRLRVPNAF